MQSIEAREHFCSRTTRKYGKIKDPPLADPELIDNGSYRSKDAEVKSRSPECSQGKGEANQGVGEACVGYIIGDLLSELSALELQWQER